jgi:TM2 domain-containing membrane protein YozV
MRRPLLHPLLSLLLTLLLSLQANLSPALAALETVSTAGKSPATNTTPALPSPNAAPLTVETYAVLPPDPVPPPPRPFCGEACWSASFFLPGSGQLFLGESLRGWGFMAGTLIAPWALSTLTMALLEIGKVPGWSGAELQQAVPFFIVAATLATISMYIWNIFDAYGVQNEKNAAWQSAFEKALEENWAQWQPKLVQTPVKGQESHWHFEVLLGSF